MSVNHTSLYCRTACSTHTAGGVPPDPAAPGYILLAAQPVCVCIHTCSHVSSVVLTALQVADIDFFTDSFPCVDVITMSMILHDWGPEKKKLLVQKVDVCVTCFRHTVFDDQS